MAKSGGDHGEKGYLYDVASDRFLGNRRRDAPLSDASLRYLALRDGGELTFTCTPPGSGVRVGIDRDEDGFLDGDEMDAGSDPADPASVPRGGGRGDEVAGPIFAVSRCRLKACCVSSRYAAPLREDRGGVSFCSRRGYSLPG